MNMKSKGSNGLEDINEGGAYIDILIPKYPQ